MTKRIIIEMPTEELADKFWAWWLDGGGEAAMYECVDGLEEIGASDWLSESKFIRYYQEK